MNAETIAKTEELKYIDDNPPCSEGSCFAYVCGGCRALTSTYFPGRSRCPFFKEKSQYDSENMLKLCGLDF